MTDSISHDEKLARLRAIIKAVDICMLTTADENGDLHSRPMSNNREVEFDGDLWFFTEASSHKTGEIGRTPKVNASFADPGGRQFASVTGEAQVVTDRAKIKELWNPMLKIWFPDGPDSDNIALLKVNAERAEYWDASQSIVKHALSFIGGLITGRQADLGENEKLELG
jgi:general stress protein 26